MKGLKKILLAATIGCLSMNSAYAGCLDGVTSTQAITSVIRGFYISTESHTENRYVVIDKSSCTASSGAVDVASATASTYYLGFTSEDAMLYTTLLAAYSRGEKVTFRLSPTELVGNSNKIAYILSPFDVNSNNR